MPRYIDIEGATPKLYQIKIENFRGVDLTSGECNVSLFRSPDAPNMMPSDDGYPVKRRGYQLFHHFQGEIHGAYSWADVGNVVRLIHAGTSLWALKDGEWEEVYTLMADRKSYGFQLSGKLWIADGEIFRFYDGKNVGAVSDIAVVPTVTIGKSPQKDIGGTSYQPVNLLTGTRKDEFLGTANDTDYYLSFGELINGTEVIVSIMDYNGDWQDGTWNSEADSGTVSFKTSESASISLKYTVDRKNGIVSFRDDGGAKKAPGASPVTGEDNVRIQYTVKSKEGIINKCRFGVLYGVNGAMDRIFLSGNPDEPNIDRWSEYNDPSYFADTSYSVLGNEGSPIVGYSILGNSLVAHKTGEENDRNAFVRTGTLDDAGNALFRITNIITGSGAASENCFVSSGSEPIFLTQRGMMAFTPSDLTGERYAQTRSYYINGALTTLSPEKLSAAVACNWGKFICLAVDGRLYLLDCTKKSYDERAAASEYQFDAWFWTGVSATAVWSWDENLYFGGENGKVYRYLQFVQGDEYFRQRYFRDGEEIDKDGNTVKEGTTFDAYWTTPLSSIGNWAYKKTVKDVWVATQPYHRTSGYIYYRTDKDAEYLARRYTADILDWNNIDFNRWTFRTLDRPYVVHTGKKAKKIILFQIKVSSPVDEPLGIYSINYIYSMAGRVKNT